MAFARPEGLAYEGRAVLAGTIWIAIWWITEAIPIPATSLLPIIIFPLTGALNISSTTASFGHQMVFLYLGGFLIALALEKWDLHKRIALNIIHLAGTNRRSLIFGFMISTALLSMWISNTAATLMMFPIALAVAKQFGEFFKVNSGTEHTADKSNFGLVIMLGIAYASSIGGIATLIGTPTNAVFSAITMEYYQAGITFSEWIKIGFPISVILLFLCWFYLSFVVFRPKGREFSGIRDTITREIEKLGPVQREEKMVIAVFSITALAWITRSFVLVKFLPFMDDTIIAIAGAMLLFILPSSKKGRLLDWETANKVPWGILLLFGGGLAIANGFSESGLAGWVGNELKYFQEAKYTVILIAVTSLVNFLTEVTSNVATASVMLPIVASLADAMDLNPYGLMMAATLAASCAFMLPVATPPNAIVFGSGYIRIMDMFKAGFWMNIISIIFIVSYIYLFQPHF